MSERIYNRKLAKRVSENRKAISNLFVRYGAGTQIAQVASAISDLDAAISRDIETLKVNGYNVRGKKVRS